MTEVLARYRETIQRDGLILLAGCGGFAAHAAHMAAELVVRYQRDRAPFRAVMLGANPAVSSAAANDYGVTMTLAREALALARRGDLVVIYSTSGQSPMLVELARTMAARQITVLAWCPPETPLAAYATVLGGESDQVRVLACDHALMAALETQTLTVGET